MLQLAQILLAGWLAILGCAHAQPFFLAQPGRLSPPSATLYVRPALFAPLRYRVLVIPGSGCRSLLPQAERMFAGLLHAEVWLAHKPWLDMATTPRDAGDCTDAFIAADRHTRWAAALTASLAAHPPPDDRLPWVLLGLSEGAELLPTVAASLPRIHTLVLIGHAGLDPIEAGALQAARAGESSAWARLLRQVTGTAADSRVVAGRTLGYWRDLQHWRLATPLLSSPARLMLAYGGKDAAMPEAAYARFLTRARASGREICVLRFPDANHSLQSADGDHLQTVWATLEAALLDTPPSHGQLDQCLESPDQPMY
jgi:hypothetical protein